MLSQYISNGIIGGVTPGLKISGAGAATLATTTAFNYKIDGVVYASVAAATLAAIPATITVPLLSTTSVGIYVNAAGTISYVQGATVLNTSLATNVLYPTASLPQEVSGKALIGWVLIKTASTATFTGGTTLLDAANVTVTYLDRFGFWGL